MTTASELFQSGDLQGAISTLQTEIKKNPTDTKKRGFLVELLCFARELERADKQLDVITTQEPEAAPNLALWRQLIRAEQARFDFYCDGRAPHLVGQPNLVINNLLHASIQIRENDIEGAMKLIEHTAEVREPTPGIINGEPFDDIRDIDDLNSGILEVMANNGQYYWVSFEQINTLEFHPPKRPIELLWRKASIDVKDGPEGEVFIPAIYINSPEEDDALLGRIAEWTEEDDQPLRGIGLRSFLVNDDVKTIMDIETLSFGNAE